MWENGKKHLGFRSSLSAIFSRWLRILKTLQIWNCRKIDQMPRVFQGPIKKRGFFHEGRKVPLETGQIQLILTLDQILPSLLRKFQNRNPFVGGPNIHSFRPLLWAFMQSHDNEKQLVIACNCLGRKKKQQLRLMNQLLYTDDCWKGSRFRKGYISYKTSSLCIFRFHGYAFQFRTSYLSNKSI